MTLLSPLQRGLRMVHVAGGRFGDWQGCVACRTTLALPHTGWWLAGSQVAESVDGTLYPIGDRPLAGREALCPGAN